MKVEQGMEHEGVRSGGGSLCCDAEPCTNPVTKPVQCTRYGVPTTWRLCRRHGADMVVALREMGERLIEDGWGSPPFGPPSTSRPTLRLSAKPLPPPEILMPPTTDAAPLPSRSSRVCLRCGRAHAAHGLCMVCLGRARVRGIHLSDDVTPGQIVALDGPTLKQQQAAEQAAAREAAAAAVEKPAPVVVEPLDLDWNAPASRADLCAAEGCSNTPTMGVNVFSGKRYCARSCTAEPVTDADRATAALVFLHDSAQREVHVAQGRMSRRRNVYRGEASGLNGDAWREGWDEENALQTLAADSLAPPEPTPAHVPPVLWSEVAAGLQVHLDAVNAALLLADVDPKEELEVGAKVDLLARLYLANRDAQAALVSIAEVLGLPGDSAPAEVLEEARIQRGEHNRTVDTVRQDGIELRAHHELVDAMEATLGLPVGSGGKAVHAAVIRLLGERNEAAGMYNVVGILREHAAPKPTIMLNPADLRRQVATLDDADDAADEAAALETQARKLRDEEREHRARALGLVGGEVVNAS